MAEEHTGGMIALLPAKPDELVVDGGDPAEELHLTLAYLGDDVTGMPDEQRTLLLNDAARIAANTPPVEAEVIGHAAFNPTGANDHEPCAVYLVTGDALPALKAEVEPHNQSEHPVFLPHVTGGYGLSPADLSYVGPVVFDRLRVALANDVHDFPLGEPVAVGEEEPMPAATTAAAAAEEAVVEQAGPVADGEFPINLPVVVIEGLDTSDGRFLTAGGLTHRALPLSLLAQPESSHGGDDAGPAGVVGRIDTLTRTPGPEVISKRTGEPFPEGTFIWSGTGHMLADARVGDYNVAELFRRGYLRGVSVDLAGMDFEVLGDEGPVDPEHPRRQLIAHTAEIAAATILSIPAFGDAYAEMADGTGALVPPPDVLAASAVPSWRSAEVGDYAPRPAITAAADEGMPVQIPADSIEQLTQVIDSGEERDAAELATAIVEHIAQNWAATGLITEDELPEEDDAMAAQLADDPGPAPDGPAPADADEADGDPAAPQTCEFDDKPATMSITYRPDKDGEATAYVAVCADDEQRARDELEKAGETVSGVVQIEGETPEAVVASAAELPPIDWFRDPELTELTPLTVTDDGRVYGHLAAWSQDHVGLPGQRIRPPHSAADYGYFHTGALSVDADGQAVEISVGKLTMDTGHAATNLGHSATVAHYDHSGSVVAQVCCGEDAVGIWYSGALMPGLDELSLRRFRGCGLSGDWRKIGKGLELVAALSVPVPGFPVPRARVASGQPVALVAAGAVLPHTDTPLDYDTLADAIAERLDARRTAGELSVAHADLVAQLDDTPTAVAALLAAVDDSPTRMAALFAELDGGSFDVSHMPPQLQEEWLAGGIAARIGWGTPGSYRRCQAIAREKGVPAHQIDGMCANLYHTATGRHPGRHGND